MLPEDVKKLLDFFDTIVSVGVPFVGTPLQCLGAGGFGARLLFFFSFPLVVLALLLLAHLAKVTFLQEKDHFASKAGGDNLASADHQNLSQMQTSKAVRAPLRVLIERAAISAMPFATQFLFVVYPILTTVAFEAFPCHDFKEEGRWLIADVSMQCGTDSHKSAVMLAWLAVLVYPIGLLLTAAVLLGSHKAEVQGKVPPTKLSKAIHFLYGNYKPE